MSAAGGGGAQAWHAVHEEHVNRIAQLEHQLGHLTEENEEFRRLLQQPEYGRTKLEELVQKIAAEEDALMKSSIEHEKLLQELLAKPSVFCDFATEAMSTLYTLLTGLQSQIEAGKEKYTATLEDGDGGGGGDGDGGGGGRGGSSGGGGGKNGSKKKNKKKKAQAAQSAQSAKAAAIEAGSGPAFALLSEFGAKLNARLATLKKMNGAFKKKPHMHKDRNMHTKRMEALQALNTSISRNQVRLHLYKRDVYAREKEIMLDVQQHQIAEQTLVRRREDFEKLKERTAVSLTEHAEHVDATHGRNLEAHAERVGAFDSTLAEAIANQMREKDENIAAMSKKLAMQEEELAKRSQRISEKGETAQQHEARLKAMEQEQRTHETSIKDFRKTLQLTKKALSAFRTNTRKERLQRMAEEEKAKEEAAAAAATAEAEEQVVIERRMEIQEDMILNLNHKFPDENSAIEFHLNSVACIPDFGTSTWNQGRSGLILDVKGIHLYNRSADQAFSIPYGGVHSWFGASVDGKEFSFSLAPKRLNEVGELKILVRSKPTIAPDMLLLLHSDAAKSIHNYLCILFDKWEGMVKTREKWEVEEARKKGRK